MKKISTSSEDKMILEFLKGALNPNKFNNTFGYVGYCSEEDMKKYDIRMI